MISLTTEERPETAAGFGPSPLDENLFSLPDGGLTEVERKTALSALSLYQAAQRVNFLGYQANQFGFYGDLSEYLTLHLNNIGDPFIDGNFTVNTKVMECAVLDYFARLWGAQGPHPRNDPNPDPDPELYWGYVLTMGSTEGNLYGMWNARDYLGGKKLVVEPKSGAGPRRLIWHQSPLPKDNENAFTPVAFYSEDTHYSIIKIMRILAIPTFYELGEKKYKGQCPINGGVWPQEVPSEGPSGDLPLGPGSIDVGALARLVEFFAARGYPILVCLNYGTTFKGAYDNVKAVGESLEPIFKTYGLWEREVVYDPDQGLSDKRSGYWIHVDGALGATYMPFIRMDRPDDPRAPAFDFRQPWVHSISTSGHKWIGAPAPTGVYMTKTKYQLYPPSDPAYIGSPDTTLAGSRSGLAPAVLWDFLARHSHAALIQRARATEEMAEYAFQHLKKLEKELGKDLWVQRTPLSLCVLFRRPKQETVFKYSLSCEEIAFGTENRKYAHIYMMEHSTREKIDSLIDDLRQDPFLEDVAPAGVAAREIASVTPGVGHPLVHVPHSGRGWR